MIRVSSGGSNYDTGLTHVDASGTVLTGSSAQGQINGTLYWKVPFDLVGSTYVYQCSAHSGMVGNIVIQQPISFVASNTTIALDQSNAAFAAANTADQKAVSAGVYANAAFAAANTADSDAGIAFSQAVTSGSYANSAFAAANTADQKAISAGVYANSSYIHANAAFAAANTAGGADTYARNHANSAYLSQNTSGDYANSAYAQANAAFTFANTISGGSAIDNTARSLANTADQKATSAFAAANTKLNSSGGTISGNLEVAGNLTVLGNSTTIQVQSLGITDPLIQLAVNNTSEILEIGFVGQHGANALHTGLVRHAEDATYYLFDNYTGSVLGNNAINIADPSLNIVTLKANLYSSSILLRNVDPLTQANAAFLAANVAYIHANAAFAAANTGGGGAGVTTADYNSRSYIANGVQTTFTISSGHTANSILVFENGICQEPITDYTVAGTTLTILGGAPAVNTRIQIRELPI
jgi:hypothetical protein